MEIIEFLKLKPADQVKALDELTKAAGRVAALKEALKASRGQPQEEASAMATTGISRAEDWRLCTPSMERRQGGHRPIPQDIG